MTTTPTTKDAVRKRRVSSLTSLTLYLYLLHTYTHTYITTLIQHFASLYCFLFPFLSPFLPLLRNM